MFRLSLPAKTSGGEFCRKIATFAERMGGTENNSLREQVALLPLSPGVYQFLDRSGTIIYVGKAKSLRKRVSSYFEQQGVRFAAHDDMADRGDLLHQTKSGSLFMVDFSSRCTVHSGICLHSSMASCKVAIFSS